MIRQYFTVIDNLAAKKPQRSEIIGKYESTELMGPEAGT